MTAPHPKPLPIYACPNPECHPEDYTDEDDFGVFEKTWPITGCKEWRVSCDCGYQGPRADTMEEAIRLHNALCAASGIPTEQIESRFKTWDGWACGDSQMTSGDHTSRYVDAGYKQAVIDIEADLHSLISRVTEGKKHE